MKINTTLFDIGNVLLAFDFAPALGSLKGPAAKQDAFELIMARKDIFEEGKEEKANYIDWASGLLDFRGSHQEFEQAWTSIFTPITPMWELAAELKKAGHRLILFSNTNCIHAPYCLENYPVFELFDGAVFSHEIGAIKPEAAFYERAIEKFSLIPEETQYFDDLPANIEAGKKFGFHSQLYEMKEHQQSLAAASF